MPGVRGRENPDSGVGLDVSILWPRAREQRAHGGEDDADGRECDQRAFDASREELDLAVSVGVIAVRGLRRHPEAVEEERARGDVDERFERVREHRGRAFVREQ